MPFNTLDFWLIFIPVILFYRFIPHKLKNVFLLSLSYFYYSLFEWRFCFIILASTITDFYCARWIYKNSSQTAKNIGLSMSLLLNLSLLIIFKYFYTNISEWGLDALVSDSVLRYSVALSFPIGISFYTFQTLSYTIDSYRDKTKPTNSFINFATYVSYFPQLLAGPIERASTLLKQIEDPQRDKSINYKMGLFIILLGLVKKNFYSSYFLTQLNELHSQETTILSLLMSSFFMIMYVYTDFSGYCDIGRGISHCFGIKLSLNFKAFYFAKNPTQLWSRWNFSLTYWVRDYVLIPLTRLYRKELWISLSILLSMSLIGIWHGFTWSWFSFGIFQGIIILVTRYTNKLSPIISPEFIKHSVHFITLSSLLVMGLIHFSIIKDFDLIHKMSQAAFRFDTHHIVLLLGAVLVYSPLLLFEVFQEKREDYDFIIKEPILWRASFIFIGLCLVVYSMKYNNMPFVYFGF